MADPIHLFPTSHAPPRSYCGGWEKGHAWTARPEAVTCPYCREGLVRCVSVSRRGVRCEGVRGHGGLHLGEADGAAFTWSDETSPVSPLDLYR